MKASDIAGIITLSLLVGTLFGIIIASNLESNKWKELAVNAGAAEYICDKKTGETTFTFISATNTVNK
jgi:hypothetical protein